MTRRGVLLPVALLAIAGLEAAVILGAWGLGFAGVDFYDHRVYHQLAVNLLERQIFSMEETAPYVPTTWRSPGYPMLVGLIYGLAGQRPVWVWIVQFGFVTLTSWFLFVFARRYIGEGAATIAAVLCVTYPALVFQAPFHVDETASVCLAVGLMAALARLRDEPGLRAWSFVLMGFGLAFQTLMRPSFLLFVGAVAMVLLFDLRRPGVGRRLVPVVALVLAFVAGVAPWIVRNSLLAGHPVTIHSGGGWTFYVSMQQYAGEVTYRLLRPEWEAVVAEFNLRTSQAEAALIASGGPSIAQAETFRARVEVLRDRQAWVDGLEKARHLRPAQVAFSVPRRLFWLWSTADASPWRTGLLHRAQQVLHVFLMVSTVVGLVLARRGLGSHGLVWLIPVYFTALHLVFAVEARYTLPARPFVLMYPALALWSLGTRIAPTYTGRLDKNFPGSERPPR